MENELYELLIWLEETSSELEKYEEKRKNKNDYLGAFELKTQHEVYKELSRRVKKIIKITNQETNSNH